MRRLDTHVETMLLAHSVTQTPCCRSDIEGLPGGLEDAPEIWEWMLTTPDLRSARENSRTSQSRQSRKLQRVLDEFDPDAIVCTQAFACGVMASWKRATGRKHLCWSAAHGFCRAPLLGRSQRGSVYRASEDTRQKLVSQGVPPERVAAFGIPTNESFQQPWTRAAVIKNWVSSPTCQNPGDGRQSRTWANEVGDSQTQQVTATVRRDRS